MTSDKQTKTETCIGDDYSEIPLPEHEQKTETPTSDDEEESYEDDRLREQLYEMRDELLRLKRNKRGGCAQECNALLGTLVRIVLIVGIFVFVYHKMWLENERNVRLHQKMSQSTEKNPIKQAVFDGYRQWHELGSWLHTERLRLEKPSPCATTFGQEPTPLHVLRYYTSAAMHCLHTFDSDNKKDMCGRLTQSVYECECLEREQCTDQCHQLNGCTLENCPCAHYRCIEYAPNTVIDAASVLNIAHNGEHQQERTIDDPVRCVYDEDYCIVDVCDLGTGKCRQERIPC